MGLSIYYMGLSRFHIGDLVKELNLDKYGFVEKDLTSIKRSFSVESIEL